MSIKVEDTGTHFAVGGVLSEEQKEALAGVSPTADDIIANLGELNEEIEDIPKVQNLPETEVPKPRGRKRVLGKKEGEERKFDPKNRVKPKDGNMSLDQELEALDNELSSEETFEETVNQATGDMRTQIMELLKKTKGAPSEKQITTWKAQHGENGVHVMAFGEGDIYVFSHLKRGQWKKVQELMLKAQGASDRDPEDSLKEKVLQHCVLWPQLTVEFFYNSRAGVVDSLYQVVLLNSYFLSPQQAMLLTTQL